MRSFFITGTDTEIGKTFAACALMHAMQQKNISVAPMKPIAAGTIDVDGVRMNEDVHALLSVYAKPIDVRAVNPYCFDEPIAPHLAARHDATTVSLNAIRDAFHQLHAAHDCVLVEGAGGFLVPMSESISMAEIPKSLSLGVILVVGMRLGCINHALLTVEAIRARGLTLAGWIGNTVDPHMSAREENIATLETAISARRLGILPRVNEGNALKNAARASTYLTIDSLLE
jgi:dethiobiotin synthetase